MNRDNTKMILDKLKDYLNLIISCLIVIIIFWLTTNFLVPNLDRIKSDYEAQKTQDKKIAIMQQKDTILSSLNKDEELNILKKITAVIPEEKDVFSIFGGLDDLEKNSGVLITNSNFRIGVVSTESAVIKTNSTVKTNYQSIDINLEVLGTPDQIISLLQNLTSFKTRLFTAKGLNISLVDKNNYSVSFILSTYYLPFPAQLGSVDTPIPSLSPGQASIKSQIIQNTLLPVDQGVTLPSGKTNLFSQ